MGNSGAGKSVGSKRSGDLRREVVQKIPRRSYHHGSLPKAFLEAAERVLIREGLTGLTVRAISREAGVSHTAAKHHFSDRVGILSELAAVGHLRLAETLASYARDLPPTRERRKAIGRGYIEFAVSNPDLFRLMSRNELLDYSRLTLRESLQISSRALAGVFDVKAEVKNDAFTPVTKQQAITITAGWGFVHGLANLLIDGRLNRLAGSVQPSMSARELVDRVIGQVSLEKQ